MKILLSLLTIVALGCGYVYYNFAPAEPEAAVPIIEVKEVDTSDNYPAISAPAQIAVYENTDYNFTFKYRIKPYGYSTFENTHDQNIEMGTLFGVTFMRSDDYNESVKAAAEGNAYDGPPGMSVYVFSASKILDLEAWMIGNKMITNCVEGEITATELASKDASVCLWDGLYPGTTIAQISNNKIYLLVGTREGNETVGGYSYEKDFNELVDSFGVMK